MDFVLWVGGGLLILLAILFVVIYGKEEFANTDTELDEIAKKANEKALKDIQTQGKSFQEITRNIIKNLFPQTQISPPPRQISPQEANSKKIKVRLTSAVKVIGGGTNFGAHTTLGDFDPTSR